MSKFATQTNFFVFDEGPKYRNVSPEMIRRCPKCERALGTLDETEHWRYCPYCKDEILKSGPNGLVILLWGNE